MAQGQQTNTWNYLNFLNQHPLYRGTWNPSVPSTAGRLPTLAGYQNTGTQSGSKNYMPAIRPLLPQGQGILGNTPVNGGGGGVPLPPPPIFWGSGTPLPPPPVFGGGKVPPPSGSNPPPSTTGSDTSNRTVITTPNTGGIYYPKPVGNASRGAWRPIRFPGVEASGGNWAKYGDGSFVDYSSPAWNRAAAIQIADPQQKQLWDAIPDSWKAEMAGWDPSFRENWLKAMSNPGALGYFNGQYMLGQQAAEEIVKLARQAQDNLTKAAQAQKQQQKQQDQARLREPRPTPYYVPSPYL